MTRGALKFLRSLALLFMGFALGMVGILAYQGIGKKFIMQTISPASKSNFALSCTPEKDRKDEIYFVSCGGIY